ncbi:MAG: hypothetical protein M3466_16995 [Gemmatimonadota bacterium]|nr:hypothetical protein [Gemmatimonadota bacterium]
MTLGQQSSAVAVIAAAIYLIGGIWLLIKGRPIRAGLVMTLASLIPLAWQLNFTESDAKGFGLLLLLMLPPASGIILAGLVWRTYRTLERWSWSAPS